MNRATRRMMKAQQTKQTIHELSKGSKKDKKEIEDFFAAGFDFSRQFWKLGTEHKQQNREILNFEQFFYFNGLAEFDFAKDGTDSITSKNMTEEFVKSVVYPAYVAGYNGIPFDDENIAKKPPSVKQMTKRVAPEFAKLANGDDKMYGDLMSLANDVNKDMLKFYNIGKADRLNEQYRKDIETFVIEYDLIYFEGLSVDLLADLAEMLWGAYNKGYDLINIS